MQFNLKNRCIAITGSGNGIGRAVSIMLVRQGAIVIGIDKDSNSLKKLKLKLKKNLVIKNLDCTDQKEIYSKLSDISNLDGLVNCAGIVPQGNLIECDDKEWQNSLNTNLTSVFLMTKYFMPIFLKKNKGSIVNISSVASSIKGVPRRFAYSATKAGIIGITKSIAVDFAKKGIRCNAICPGTVDTPTWRKRVLNSKNPKQSRKDFNSRQIIGRVGKPEEISDLIAFLLSERSSFVTGSVYNIDGGMSL